VHATGRGDGNSSNGVEQVFDAVSGALRSQGNYLYGRIRSIEFDGTSSLVLAAGASETIVVADAGLGLPVAVLDGQRSAVLVAHCDPNARHVVGASWDDTARVWDVVSPPCLPPGPPSGARRSGGPHVRGTAARVGGRWAASAK
jgi:WD40 repeat protein